MKTLSLLIPLSIALLLSACGGDNKKKPPKANTSPIAMAASVTTQADTPATGKLMASDADKDRLSFAVSTPPVNGTLTLETDGSFRYLPNVDFTGTDQFAFTVSDGKATSTSAMVNITIDLLAVNMGAYTRKAFAQTETDTPLSLDSRAITQDATEETAFDDLLMP